MPAYDYFCKSCEHRFEEVYKISDRNVPTEKPCPKCGEKTIVMQIGSPLVADAFKLGIKKPTQEFREIMKRMKKTMPGNNLKDY